MPKAFLGVVAAVIGGIAPCPDCPVKAAHAVTPAAAAAAVAASAADTARAKLAIAGMTCGSCATTARIVLERVDGVFDATVSYDSANAVVLYDPARTSPETFIARLEQMTGYKAAVVAEPAKPEGT